MPKKPKPQYDSAARSKMIKEAEHHIAELETIMLILPEDLAEQAIDCHLHGLRDLLSLAPRESFPDDRTPDPDDETPIAKERKSHAFLR